MAGDVLANVVAGNLVLIGDQVADTNESYQIELLAGNYVITGLSGTTINGGASDSFANAAVDLIIATPGLGTNEIHFSTAIDPADSAVIDGNSAANTLKLFLDDGGAHVVTLTADDAGGYDGSTDGNISFDEVDELSAGGNTGDELKTYNTATTWTVNDTSGNTLKATTSTVKFSGFEKLTGDAAKDTFNVQNNTATAYTLSGGAGVDEFNFGSANKLDSIANITIHGDANSATLTLHDQGNISAINYTAGASTIGRTGGGTVTYDGITDLTLNASNGTNKITITAVPTATGTKTFNGGIGSDTLDLSALAASDVTLTAANATSGFDGTVTGVTNFTAIEEIKGNGAGDLTGLNEAATWTINDSTGNTYVAKLKTLKFAGFDTLTGGTAIDIFNVQDNSVSANYTLNGGAARDEFNFGLANSLAAITKNIAVNSDADQAVLTLNDQGVATNLNYTVGANTIGRDTGGTVTHTGLDDLTLNASNGSNTIKITAIPATTGAKSFNGGTGDDVLDVSGFANPVVVLQAPNATKGWDGATTAGSFSGIETFKGSNPGIFQGDDELGTFTINDSGTNTYVSQSRTANISGFNLLQGGSKVDIFNVLDNSGAIPYILNGGDGLDQFNFGLANSLAGITKNILVQGDNDRATLTLNDQGVATNLNYTAGATTIGRDTGGTVTFNFITDLTLNASNGSNTIKVTDIPLTAGTKTFNGGTGDDVLDITALTANDVTLTAANATNGFNGTVTGVANFTGVEELKGNGTGDLTGINEDATWTINDAAGHTYLSQSRTLKFSGFDNLNGGSKVDTYKVQNNAVSNTFTLSGNAGGDKFLIGDTVNKLFGLKNLAVVGGADAGDELTLNDNAEAGANDYTVTATTAADDGGIVVTHTTVEKITLKASNGANAVKVIDGTYNPATTLNISDTAGASTLAVDDSGDAGNNSWSISSTQVQRTAPVPALTIDYSGQATITSLSYTGGSAIDNVAVNSTKVATSVTGNAGNDVFTVGNGNFNNFLGQLTINGGTHDLVDTRTVFKGGFIPGPADIVFNAKSSAVAKGDTLIVSDALQGGVTKYSINNTTVSRDGAAKSVTYSNIEALSLLAGKDESDIKINLPAAAPDLPFVVSVDGGNAAKDNRVQIKGTTGVDAITVGNGTNVETNRSQFEVSSVTRLWVEGNKGADVIHNRSSVPGLLDGGYTKSNPANDVVNLAVVDDVIASDAPSTSTFSPVVLGNDGADFLYTTNSSTSGTTYLVGDYFVNNNVPLTAGSASKTSRLQVVAGPGQAGDRYVTNHTPAAQLRNRVLARLDAAANSYSGKFANLTADTIGNTLGVIEWLRGRLPLTVSASGMAGELSRINFFIRQFVRDPGSAAAPAYPNATYNPGGVASGGSFNGGEAIEEDIEPTPLVQNPFDAGDVNGDGRITAFDALLIINELNRNGVHQLDTSPAGAFGVNGGGETNRPIDFLDVNGDRSVSAFDALLVINRLNNGGPTAATTADPFQWFTAADAAEQAAADFVAMQLASSSTSLSDEALLALLAADANE